MDNWTTEIGIFLLLASVLICPCWSEPPVITSGLTVEETLYSGCDLTTSTFIESDLISANLTYLRTRPFEEVDITREFHCDLEHDDCGLTNQRNMPAYFRLAATNFGGKNTMSFSLGEPERMQSIGARLITPYFIIGRAHLVCLSFDYFVSGPGVRKIELHSQDVRNCVIARMPTSLDPAVTTWRKQRISLLAMGDVRFFIEAHTTPGESGAVAIDNIHFVHRQC